MSKLKALIFASDRSPNDGEAGPRPVSRAFVFETDCPLEEVLVSGWLQPKELGNVQVGESIEVRGPDYIRFFRVDGKQGDQVQMTVIGTQDGPVTALSGQAVVPAGEVFAVVSTGETIDPEKISLTPLNCNCPYLLTATDKGFEIDIETAWTEDILFNWVVQR